MVKDTIIDESYLLAGLTPPEPAGFRDDKSNEKIKQPLPQVASLKQQAARKLVTSLVAQHALRQLKQSK